MPELRKDPVTNRWIVVFSEKDYGPEAYPSEDARQRTGGFCPLCAGNEDKTPPEIMAYRSKDSKPNDSRWSLRVIPNKFPALKIEGDHGKKGFGVYDRMNGIGAHEVLVETTDHDAGLEQLQVEQVEMVLRAYRERFIDLHKDNRFRYVMIFKNYGRCAGATLEHSHSQIIALPIIPKRVLEELSQARRYYKYRDRCMFCDMMEQEKMDSRRIVFERDHFIAFAPYAPRFPFEVWILPKKHEANFCDINGRHCHDLAITLKTVLQKMQKLLKYPPYNFVLHTAPLNDGGSVNYYHWHIEIMPRLVNTTGFEWGSGFYTNPTTPEKAAKLLREI